MNPADIWTTLRLPTRVKASKPAFSLRNIGCHCFETKKRVIFRNSNERCKGVVSNPYTDTDEPIAVPNNPSNKIPIPWCIVNWLLDLKKLKRKYILGETEIVSDLPADSSTENWRRNMRSTCIPRDGHKSASGLYHRGHIRKTTPHKSSFHRF